MLKKIILLLVFIYPIINFAQFYVPDTYIDSIVKKEVKKEFKKFARKNLSCKQRKEHFNILPIYWMYYHADSISNKIILDKENLKKNLKFRYKTDKRTQSKKFQNRCHGVVYNDDYEFIASFNQIGSFFGATLFDHHLLKVIRDYNIKYVFQIDNLYTKGLPNFLVDQNGNIFVYIDIVTGDGKILYNDKILSLEEFKPFCCFDVDTYLKGEYNKD